MEADDPEAVPLPLLPDEADELFLLLDILATEMFACFSDDDWEKATVQMSQEIQSALSFTCFYSVLILFEIQTVIFTNFQCKVQKTKFLKYEVNWLSLMPSKIVVTFLLHFYSPYIVNKQ